MYMKKYALQLCLFSDLDGYFYYIYFDFFCSIVFAFYPFDTSIVLVYP